MSKTAGGPRRSSRSLKRRVRLRKVGGRSRLSGRRRRSSQERIPRPIRGSLEQSRSLRTLKTPQSLHHLLATRSLRPDPESSRTPTRRANSAIGNLARSTMPNSPTFRRSRRLHADRLPCVDQLRRRDYGRRRTRHRSTGPCRRRRHRHRHQYRQSRRRSCRPDMSRQALPSQHLKLRRTPLRSPTFPRRRSTQQAPPVRRTAAISPSQSLRSASHGNKAASEVNRGCEQVQGSQGNEVRNYQSVCNRRQRRGNKRGNERECPAKTLRPSMTEDTTAENSECGGAKAWPCVGSDAYRVASTPGREGRRARRQGAGVRRDTVADQAGV